MNTLFKEVMTVLDKNRMVYMLLILIATHEYMQTTMQLLTLELFRSLQR
jgi:hypothetical protein